MLTRYLSGNKKYVASVELGFETDTLDMEGNVTKTASFDHVTKESIEATLPQFIGNISQVPPIYSAIKKDGRKLYEEARDGKSEEDLIFQQEISSLNLLNFLIQITKKKDFQNISSLTYSVEVEYISGHS